MEGVKRTNTVVMNPNQQVGVMPRLNPYVMDVD